MAMEIAKLVTVLHEPVPQPPKYLPNIDKFKYGYSGTAADFLAISNSSPQSLGTSCWAASVCVASCLSWRSRISMESAFCEQILLGMSFARRRCHKGQTPLHPGLLWIIKILILACQLRLQVLIKHILNTIMCTYILICNTFHQQQNVE